MAEENKNIKSPQEGFQDFFVRSNVDVAIGGGVLGCGKSFAAVLALAEAVKDPNFRAVFLRKQATDTKVGGGLLDDLKDVYEDFTEIRGTGSNPRMKFPSGASVDLAHANEDNIDKLLERVKGWQYDLVYFDEGTGFDWRTFLTIMSRNRGKASWTGKVRMTTNPKKTHWLRRFLDWWIGPDGFVIPERSGVVRYFYVSGNDVNSVIWGDTKEAVYRICKSQIDRKIKSLDDENITYENLIKSCTFYLGKMSENKILTGNNKGYVGSIAAMGETNSRVLLEGCWNVNPDSDRDLPIKNEDALRVFDNDPQVNNDKWITADLADIGSDNFVALVWNGFHVIDMNIMCKSTPRQNAERLLSLARQYGIADHHIIYDATRAIYINDYIEDAIPFISSNVARGIDFRSFATLKDVCYWRLVRVIANGSLSFDRKVGNREYIHSGADDNISVQAEFMDECNVVNFKDQPSGKRRLLTKREMNANLGRNRSMDLLNPCAMRMLPVLDLMHGEELGRTALYGEEEEDNIFGKKESIYEDSTWF